MGCWNGTCMISNLPIVGGEPVVGYLIEYFSWGKDYSGRCYSNDLANPFGLSIRGCYDEYGSIESVNQNSIAVKYIKHLFKEDDFYELLNDIVEDGRTIKLNRTGKENGVGLVMIRQDIFNSLIKSHTPTHYDVNVDKILSEFENTRKLLKNKESFLKKYNSKNHEDTAFLLGMRRSASRFGIRVDILEEQDISDLINFVLNANDKQAEEEFAKIIRDDLIMRDVVRNLRKLWIAPAGKGSQMRDIKSHLALSNAIKESVYNSLDTIDMYKVLIGKKDL